MESPERVKYFLNGSFPSVLKPPWLKPGPYGPLTHVYTCDKKAKVKYHTCRSEQGHVLIWYCTANFHRLIKVWEGHNPETII